MDRKIIILITMLLSLSLLSIFVSADLGPKPSADFYVTYDGSEISDISFKAKKLRCVNSECLIPSYIDDGASLGSESISCHNSNCYFLSIPRKFRLAVYLPSKDKIYLSDITPQKSFRSTFEANLLPDGTITLKETTPFLESYTYETILTFLIALILTLILEMIVALIFMFLTKTPWEVLFSVLIVNILSLPIVWFVFPWIITNPFYSSWKLMIFSAEIFAFIFEGYLIHLINKDKISLKKSFLLSFLMNLASLIIGGWIFLVFGSFISNL